MVITWRGDCLPPSLVWEAEDKDKDIVFQRNNGHQLGAKWMSSCSIVVRGYADIWLTICEQVSMVDNVLVREGRRGVLIEVK